MTAAEPTVASFGGRHPGRIARRLFFATRPQFLTASALPVLLGSVWGYRADGSFGVAIAVIALLATVFVHAGANVLNDVFDDLSGTDRINRERIFPFSGGSRFIQNRIITRSGMAVLGVGLLAASLPFAIALVAARGIGVIVFGLTGVALGVLYSAPPVQLCHRGLGEATVAVAFGILPVMGAAWLQTGSIDPAAGLVGTAVGLWAASILLANEIPDSAADAAVGKRTLPVRLGVADTMRVYVGLQWTACIFVSASTIVTDLPVYAIVVPALLASVASLVARATAKATASKDALIRCIKVTLAVHTVGTLWLVFVAAFHTWV